MFFKMEKDNEDKIKTHEEREYELQKLELLLQKKKLKIESKVVSNQENRDNNDFWLIFWLLFFVTMFGIVTVVNYFTP